MAGAPTNNEAPSEVLVEHLTQTECAELLATHEVGRFVVVIDDQPEIFPVNYVFKDGQLGIRTGPGRKFVGAQLRRVAFEIDEIDESTHAAWDVVVKGVGQDVTTAYDEDIRAEPLEPWAGGDKTFWIRILPTSISGRRLIPLPEPDV